MEIWTGVTDASLTHSLTTLKDRATQLLTKYKSEALVTQSQTGNGAGDPSVVGKNLPVGSFASFSPPRPFFSTFFLERKA